jgi:hypothetical protein
MNYKKKSTIVEATRHPEYFEIKLPDGRVIDGNPGDWEVVDLEGNHFVVGHEIFLRRYEPFDEEGWNAFTK